MQDDDLVREVAAGYVRDQGAQAVHYLREREAIAHGRGDALSAQAWGDIAEAAGAILCTSGNTG